MIIVKRRRKYKQKYEVCPKCNSPLVYAVPRYIFFTSLIAIGLIFIITGMFYKPLWVIAGIFIIISPLSFIAPHINICKVCKFSWLNGQAHTARQKLKEKKK